MHPPSFKGRPQPRLIIARAKSTRTERRDAVLSALGDGETAFQISDTTRSAAYLVTKQECCLQVSN